MKSLRIVLAVSILALSTAFLVDDNLDGVNFNYIEPTANLGNDFYYYANCKWLKQNPVPSDLPRWGSFDELSEDNNKKIRAVLEIASADTAAANGSLNQKLRDFYLSGMDTVAIEKDGVAHLQPMLSQIASANTIDSVFGLLGEMNRMGIDNFVGLYVSRDIKNSNSNVIYISQSGLGLPDKEYYLKSDARSELIITKYKEHIAAMLGFAKFKSPKDFANMVYAFETKMAKVSMSRVEMRDDENTYHPYTFTELCKLTPNLNWKLYFEKNNIPTNTRIIVQQPEFFKSLNGLLKETDHSVITAYLSWRTISSFATNLNAAVVNENFNFYGKTISGTTTMRPRWKRLLSACDNSLGEVVGQLYINKYFSADVKKRVKLMVNNLLKAYEVRIKKLDWMSEETKKKALAKLELFNTKLGYPDVWIDYKNLTIKRDAYVLNVIRANQFDYDRMIGKLNKPVDKGEWMMLPHHVNAYYEPTFNEIVFPAAIMQPPFYFVGGDEAANYGALGAVIGHEITHGFDDQGSKYDGYGNLNDWWTEQDRALFNERTKILVDCYNKFEALPNTFVNGELTLGENIADLGGLSVAYEAYQIYKETHKDLAINNYSGDQRFFLAFAQVWKQNILDETLRNRLITDVHSPANFRVNGTLSNMPEFYKVFNLDTSAKLYRSPSERAVIW